MDKNPTMECTVQVSINLKNHSMQQYYSNDKTPWNFLVLNPGLMKTSEIMRGSIKRFVNNYVWNSKKLSKHILSPVEHEKFSWGLIDNG